MGAFDDVRIREERDVFVEARDGARICVDVLRPDTDEPVPVIVCMSPYGKDAKWLDSYPDHGIEISEWAVWETPDPGFWAPHGYAIVRADSRGIGKSEGRFDPASRTDTNDYYDVIEWAASQPWSTGRVGLLGISWYSIVQWKVAAEHPPHLAAIVPWEGANDLYREKSHQGGIFANGFLDFWWQMHWVDQDLLNTDDVVDWRVEQLARPLDDEWYRERSTELEKVEVPVLSVGNWGALHLHLRGNVEGFQRVASRHKRLMMIAGSHVDPFYTEWGKAAQLRFLDRWVKGIENGAENDPPVRLAIRHGEEIEWRDEQEWPLARTRYTPYHLDANTGSLSAEAPAAAGAVGYEAPHGGTVFTTPPMTEETEITGPVVLTLWLESSAPDADVFVQLHHLGADGVEREGIGPRGGPIPMALGWLRASHRELDPERSRPERPWHKHESELPLTPGEPVRLDIEVWPTSITLAPGDRLELEVRADDGVVTGLVHDSPVDRAPERFAGTNTIHTGGAMPSRLVLPIVPFDPSRPSEGERIASPPHRFASSVEEGNGVHVLFADGRWTVELDGYGQITRHDTRDIAIDSGRTRARRARAWLAVHDEDGAVAWVEHFDGRKPPSSD